MSCGQDEGSLRDAICRYLYHGGPRSTIKDLIDHLKNEDDAVAVSFSFFLNLNVDDFTQERVIEDKVAILLMFDMYEKLLECLAKFANDLQLAK